MSDINTIILTGTLVHDPELRYTEESQIAYCKFTLSVERYQREAMQKSGKVEYDLVNCITWRGSAEFVANYLDRGTPVYIEGRLAVHRYTTQDGDKRVEAEVSAHIINSLETKAASEERRSRRQ